MVDTIDWRSIEERQAFLIQKLADPSVDSTVRRDLQKEASRLTFLLEFRGRISDLSSKIDEIEGQIASYRDDETLVTLLQEERTLFMAQREGTIHELEETLFPADPLDSRSVYLEIRAGTGGQEAALFAADLLRMYTNYALRKGWKVVLEDASTTDLGGYKEAVIHIAGEGVYGHLKHESGVHRVQRVPATETAGRVHTSTATVAVLPEASAVEIAINPADLRIDTYRSGGAGGQHVNKTESAIRITHIPTGVVVSCQEERSQHKNKAKAMKMLQSRLLAAQVAQQASERSEQRREQVGTGERAEKVRTYNFPQNRITDHQVDLTLKNLDVVITGELDPILDALREKERADRRRKPILSDY